MPDTPRTLAALQALLADNTAGDISPQDVRDLLVSLFPQIAVGDLPGIDASGIIGRLPATVDGYVLTLDATQPFGFKWANDAAAALSGHVAAADPHTGYRLESADHSHASSGLQGGLVAHGALAGVGADDHHAQSHVFSTAAGLGASHTASGLTAGQILIATGATAAAFVAMSGEATLAGSGALTVAATHSGSAHHASVTIGADAEHSLAGQVLSGVDSAAGQKGHIQLAGHLGGTAASPTVVNHAAIAAGDLHTNFAILAGRAGGQVLYGGTAASETLTLNSTSHATLGYVSVEGTRFIDEAGPPHIIRNRWKSTGSISEQSYDITNTIYTLTILGNNGVIATASQLKIKVVPVLIDREITLVANDITYNAAASPVNLIDVESNITLADANMSIRGYMFSPTVILGGNPPGTGMGVLLNARATFKNDPAVAIAFTGLIAFHASLAIQADGQTLTAPQNTGFTSNPRHSVINSGVLTVTLDVGFLSQCGTNTGVTITTRTGFRVNDGTGAGSVGTQIGLDIQALTKGTTNIGIQNQSNYRGTGYLSLLGTGAPSNTTDGDLTAKRAVLGTDAAMPASTSIYLNAAVRVNANIGFFNATPAAQQTSGANLTNNVTAGGTTDQIDNFTDLTTYSNSAAAIRNDIYQLARKLKQVNDGLRTLGLLT